jgi:Lrp/AsnC family transcriptional regulator for asnA, asnC and gidA
LESPKIDLTDAKILRMLLKESRTSFTDIAKECKITVGAVRMRYKRLWKEGIINGEVTLINPHCLGYRHIVDLEIISDAENEKQVAAFLESKPHISHVFSHAGSFLGKVALRDLNKLSKIVEDLESNHQIKHVDTLIWSEAVNIEFPLNLIIKPLKQDNCHKIERSELTDLDQKPMEVDEIDRKIALILSRKSRTPFRKIAEQLEISTKTVIQRYKKLRETLFTRSTITLDLNKLGYKSIANLYIKVTNRSKMNEVYRQLLQTPNVIVIIRLVGNFDLYVAVALEDFDNLFKTRELIGKINYIEEPHEFLVPSPPSWPFNLFPSLLENDNMPKHWTAN